MTTLRFKCQLLVSSFFKITALTFGNDYSLQFFTILQVLVRPTHTVGLYVLMMNLIKIFGSTKLYLSLPQNPIEFCALGSPLSVS